jgi:hypothetical protein
MHPAAILQNFNADVDRCSAKLPAWASRFGWALDAGQQIGVVGRIEIGMDRGEDCVGVALRKFDVSGRDLNREGAATIVPRRGEPRSPQRTLICFICLLHLHAPSWRASETTLRQGQELMGALRRIRDYLPSLIKKWFGCSVGAPPSVK